MTKRSSRPWVVLIILTMINMWNYLDRYLLAGMLTPIKAETGFSDGDLGRIGTAFMIGYVLTSPIFGWLGDRWKRTTVILLGLISWNLGVFMTGHAYTLAGFILWRSLVGIGEASYVAGAPSVLSDYFGGISRNTAMTIFYTAVPFGSAMGFALGGQLAQWVGWRNTFVFAGCSGLIVAALMYFVTEPERGAQDECKVVKAPPTKRDYLDLLKHKSYMLLVIGYASYNFVLTGYGFWGPVFFQRHFGMGVAESSSFFGVALALSGLFGTCMGGWLGNILRSKYSAGYPLLLVASVILALPCTVFLLTAQTLLAAQVWLVAAMIVMFLGTGPVTTMILDIVQPHMRTSAVAFSTLISYILGSMWAAELIGRMADAVHGDLRLAMTWIMPGSLVITIVVWGACAQVEWKSHAIKFLV